MSEKYEFFPQSVRATLPPLNSSEGVQDPQVMVKFFDPTGSWTWYAIEGEAEDDEFTFYGLVDGFESELGYFTLRDLETAKEGLVGLKGLPIERDIHWEPRPLSQVRARSGR